MKIKSPICRANQLTGFYIRATLAFNGLLLKWKIGYKDPVVSPSELDLLETIGEENFPKS